MIIHNIRRGFATNSSSTHSIIVLPASGDAITDTDLGDDGAFSFGWQHFTAVSREAKVAYLFKILANKLGRDGAALTWLSDMAQYTDGQFWATAFAPVLGASVQQFLDTYASSSLDHESMISLPGDYDRFRVAVHPGFFRALTEFMLNPRVAILGSNNNDDSVHPLEDMPGATNVHFQAFLYVDGEYDVVCREDEAPARGDAATVPVGTPQRWFTFFNRETGDKTRIGFPVLSDVATLGPVTRPEKASAPELVDVKITDFCPFGCAYCYQGSTVQGQHAYAGNLDTLAGALARMKVFEVALGGGEPTMHPNFADILRAFRMSGIIPNFTSRSTAWLRSPAFPVIQEMMGAVAFSVNTAEDVRRFQTAADLVGLEARKVHFQYVVGTSSDEDFTQLLEAAEGYQVTLLGYKTAGRGAWYLAQVGGDVRRQNWPLICKRAGTTSVGIDTALALMWQHEIEVMGIPEETYHLYEGKFSMYIDAVTNRMAPSSYCDEAEYRSLPIAPRKAKGYDAYKAEAPLYDMDRGTRFGYAGQDLLDSESLKNAILKEFIKW